MQCHRFRVLIAPQQTIQLNPHQAPLVYATLAAAYGIATKGTSVLPDGVLVEAPEQGRVSVNAGEPIAFGWSMLSVDHRDAELRCNRLIKGLRMLGARSPSKTKPLVGGFVVLEARNFLTGKAAEKDFSGVPISEHVALAEPNDEESHAFRIRLTTPLRIQRPAVERRQSGHAFMDSSWFCGTRWFSSVQQRLRHAGLDSLVPSSTNRIPPSRNSEELRREQLVWIDLPYQGEGGKKSLGGVVGEFALAGLPSEFLPALFWGQIVGAGRNTAMGLGRYQVLDTQFVLEADTGPISTETIQSLTAPLPRSASLLEYALSPGSIDRAAARYDLPVAQASVAAHEIRCGRYQPRSASRFTLRDKDKRPRIMTVPARLDRALQVAILESLAPAVDRYLETSSFAFRKGLGRHTAAKAVKRLSGQGFRWAVRSDIFRFFDEVDQQLLRSRIAAHFPDPPLIELLMTWVRSSPSRADGSCSKTDEEAPHGLPTGAPISPVLANLLLDRFDEHISASGAQLIRYADDFLILHKSKAEAEQALAIAHAAAEDLKLQLNGEKTAIHEPEAAFDFLGFRFEREQDWRFRSLLPAVELDALGWTDLNDKMQSGRQVSRIPLVAGEARGNPGAFSPVVILSPRVTRLAGSKNELHAFNRVNQVLSKLKCQSLRTLIIQGTPTIEGSALKKFAEYKIDAFCLARSGHPQLEFRTRLRAGSAKIRRAQVGLQRDDTIRVAKSLVAAKLRNTATMSRCLLEPIEAASLGERLLTLAERAEQAQSLEQLMGFEGTGAAAWYRALGENLPKQFRFKKRISPRAHDPTNAMLNIAHTHMHRWCESAALTCGLLPELGALHQPRAGHSSLASDFQEPFRHLADRAVWVACQQLSAADFQEQSNAQHPILIRPRAMRVLFQALYGSLSLHVESNEQEGGSYREHIFRQARRYRKWLLQPQLAFEAFCYKTWDQ